MMEKFYKIVPMLLALLILPAGAASAAEKDDGAKFVTILVCNGKNSDYRVGDGDYVPVQAGMQIPESAELRVNGRNDSLELALPDGSSVKVFGQTSLSIRSLSPKIASGKSENLIQLLMGRIFAKVQKTDNQDFRVETATGIAAVRGTKFGVSYVPGDGGKVAVMDGRVEVLDPAGVYQPVMLNPGFQSTLPAAAGASPSAPFALTPSDIAQFDESGASASSAGSVNGSGNGGTGGNIPVPSGGNGGTTASPVQKKTEGSCTQQGFNWSIASVTIGDTVWNQLLLSPTFKFGDLTFGLYLTMYFQNLQDVISPTHWYDWDEWSFGFSTNSKAWNPVGFLQDTLLKLRFLQYKTKDVFVGVGNLDSMSIGHGSFINEYANDLEFPSRRVIGGQFGWDLGNYGFELMSGDVSQLRLLSGRAYVRPLLGPNGPFLFKNLSVGISGFVDLNPFQGTSNLMFDVASSNKVFGYGIDFDLPVLDLLGVTATVYGDADTLGWTSAAATNASRAMKGYGLFAGVKGSVLMFDYRGEYRYLNNGFIPNYVDKFYDIMSVSNFERLTDPANTNNFNGFLFEASKNFDNIGGVTLSYQEYFAYGIPTSTNHNNFLHFEAYIDKCLAKNLNLPVKGYASVAFDKSQFDWSDFTVWNRLLNNGVLTAKIFYEPSDGVAIGATYKKFYVVNPDGSLSVQSSISLETQMGL
jgi:hypothetical protein